jgi:hypothetical protein
MHLGTMARRRLGVIAVLLFEPKQRRSEVHVRSEPPLEAQDIGFALERRRRQRGGTLGSRLGIVPLEDCPQASL